MQVLESKPQLAAYSGFHGTTTPLHRAAAGGHLDICCAIIDLIKARIDAAESAAQSVKQRASSGKRWRALLRTVINQRTNRGLTPLMVACEHG